MRNLIDLSQSRQKCNSACCSSCLCHCSLPLQCEDVNVCRNCCLCMWRCYTRSRKELGRCWLQHPEYCLPYPQLRSLVLSRSFIAYGNGPMKSIHTEAHLVWKHCELPIHSPCMVYVMYRHNYSITYNTNVIDYTPTKWIGSTSKPDCTVKVV